jgi:hypothetical protein
MSVDASAAGADDALALAGRHSNGEAHDDPLDALSASGSATAVADAPDDDDDDDDDEKLSAPNPEAAFGCDVNSRWATRCCNASTVSDFRSVARSMNIRISSANISGSHPGIVWTSGSFFLRSSLPNNPPPLFCSMSAAVEASSGMVCVWM